jgi:hypothetical protein
LLTQALLVTIEPNVRLPRNACPGNGPMRASCYRIVFVV